MSYNEQFDLIYKLNNGYARRHFLVNANATDYKYLEEIAIEKALIGFKVDIMPILNQNDSLRQIICPDAIGNKNPDLRIEDILWEVKRPENPQNFNNIKHSIDNASHQANFVMINIEKNIEHDLKRIAKGRFIDHKQLTIIEFRINKIYTKFLREDFVK